MGNKQHCTRPNRQTKQSCTQITKSDTKKKVKSMRKSFIDKLVSSSIYSINNFDVFNRYNFKDMSISNTPILSYL